MVNAVSENCATFLRRGYRASFIVRATVGSVILRSGNLSDNSEGDRKGTLTRVDRFVTVASQLSFEAAAAMTHGVLQVRDGGDKNASVADAGAASGTVDGTTRLEATTYCYCVACIAESTASEHWVGANAELTIRLSCGTVGRISDALIWVTCPRGECGAFASCAYSTHPFGFRGNCVSCGMVSWKKCHDPDAMVLVPLVSVTIGFHTSQSRSCQTNRWSFAMVPRQF